MLKFKFVDSGLNILPKMKIISHSFYRFDPDPAVKKITGFSTHPVLNLA